MADAKTPLEIAIETLATDPDNARLRLHFFGRLAETELFVSLLSEADEDTIEPRLVTIDDCAYMQVFDLEEKLAELSGRVSSYAALTGRALVKMIAGRNLGLMLNPTPRDPGLLVEPDTIDWLRDVLEKKVENVDEAPDAVMAPLDLPYQTLAALNERLAKAQGLARQAYLVSLSYQDGNRRNALAFLDAAPGSEPTLTQAITEALIFAGAEPATLDIAFLRSDQPTAGKMQDVGLRFDIPQGRASEPPMVAPGSDPDKPPKLH